jgi:aspartate/methionine/tyrosine aminotransferase
MLRCGAWNAARGFASSKELARDILVKAHVAVVPGTDFGVPDDLRLAFCNERYNEAIDRLRAYFTSSVRSERSVPAKRPEAIETSVEA